MDFLVIFACLTCAAACILFYSYHRQAGRKVYMPTNPSRQMYTSHPDANAIRVAMPTEYATAASNALEITYNQVREMRATVWQLADEVEHLQPNLVLFFATGGIPYVLPLLHCLADRGRLNFLDGKTFHMFPGLVWEGKIEGGSSEDYFCRTFAGLLPLEKCERLSVLVIDTTNTGNAVNNAVKALDKALSSRLESRPDRVEIRVVGIVNGSHPVKERDRRKRAQIATPQGAAWVKLPDGYSNVSPLEARAWVAFTRDAGPAPFQLYISYWVESALPTEDEAELLGAKSDHAALAVESTEEAGRLVILHANGCRSPIALGRTPGSTLSKLVASADTATPWQTLMRTDSFAEAECASLDEAAEVTEDYLRLMELDNADAATTIAALAVADYGLRQVDVYWLSKQHRNVILPHALQLLGKTRSLLARNECRDETVEAAIALFANVYPDLAADAPRGTDQQALHWWLERIGERLADTREAARRRGP
ncbi:hypothetical protein [Sorangium sp. So ce131]|uniref:hypothetical protein n=1 Tax=Sorangium sp. So ce131 TaxID=3133282 RepID=UPI003F5F87EE